MTPAHTLLALLLFGFPAVLYLLFGKIYLHSEFWREFNRDIPDPHHLAYQNNPETFQ